MITGNSYNFFQKETILFQYKSSLSKKGTVCAFRFLFYCRGLLKLFKKILIRLFLVLVSLLVFISLLLILFTQVSPFRGWLADMVLSFVNDGLEAEISVSDLYLNPFSGVEVWDATMVAGGDTLAYVEKITIDADFFDLLGGKITVTRLELDNPRILLARKEGAEKWNFEMIARPGPEEPPGPLPELVFDIKNLALNNASVRVRDHNTSDSAAGKINFTDIDVRNLNLILDAYANLKELGFAADIKCIAFKEKKSGFELKNLSLKAKAGKNGFELTSLGVKTPNSNLMLSAKAENVNLFDSITEFSLASGKYNLNINFDKLSPNDYGYFIDVTENLKDGISLEIDAWGTLAELSVEKFLLSYGSTEIGFKASGTNLAIDRLRKLNIDFDKSNIEMNDLEQILPHDIYSSIPALEFASIETLSASYSGGEIITDFDIKTGSGTVKGNAGLNIEDEIYKGRVFAENLNISGLSGSPSLESSISAEIDFSGRGFDLAAMETKVKINSTASKLLEYGYNGLKLSGRISKGIIYADTLVVAFGKAGGSDNPEFSDTESGSLSFNGFISMKNPSLPEYNGSLILNYINLMDLLKAPDAPASISGELMIEGSGLSLDELNGKITADINYLEFRDKAFMPFRIETGFESKGQSRKLDIASSFMDISVTGDFNYDNLISLIETQGSYLAGYIGRKVYDVDFGRQSDSLMPESLVKLDGFKPFDLKIKGQIRDLSPMAAFLESTKLVLNAGLDITVNVTDSASSVRIDSLVINNFFFETQGINLAVRPTKIRSSLAMDIRDSSLHLTNLGLSLASKNAIVFNGMNFSNPFVRLDIADDVTNFRISGSYGSDIAAAAEGSVTLRNKRIDLNLEKLNASYKKSINYYNTKPITGDITSFGFNISSFEIAGDSADTVSISGKFNDFVSNDVKLRLANLSPGAFSAVLPESVAAILKRVKGKIENLELVINDSLINPDIKLHLQSSNLLIDNMPVGSLQVFLHHSNAIVKGSAGLVRRTEKDFRKLLSIDINSLPVNLSLKGVKDRIHERSPLNASVYTDNLPLHMFAPFMAGIADNLKGNLNFSVDLFGSLNENISYSGKVKINNAFFHLVPNNMSYFADAVIELKENNLDVKNIEIRNTPNDLAKGRLNLKGSIGLKEFSPISMNAYVQSRGFKVMSQASAASMPSLFGDIIISTGPEDISFSSDFYYSTLIGSINIDYARLFMPNKRSTKSTISKIKYEVVGKKINVALEDSSKTEKLSEENFVEQKQNGNGENAATGSFYDGMAMDLDIKITKPIYMDMDLFSLLFTQKLTAEIGVLDQSTGLKFFKERSSGDARLYGELELKKGSKLSFIKVFNTDGTISFPTGNMGDPYLNLSAEYNGVTDINNTQRSYKVTLKITGSKDMPKIDFNYSIDNEPATGDSTKIREDALFLLIAGRTKAELFSSGGAQANIVNELGNTGLSTAVSTALSQILAGTIIRSADIELSESWEETKLKLSGQLVGYVGWKLGGNVADFMGNNEITIELPLDFLLSNALFQFTWTTNTETLISKDQKKGEFKLKWGISY